MPRAVQTQSVIKKALALPPVERASLIEELLASFDRQSRASIDAAWAKEVEERIDAHDGGRLDALPLESVIERINKQ